MKGGQQSCCPLVLAFDFSRPQPPPQTATTPIMTDNLVGTFRFDHLRSESDSGDATANILKQITVITLADNVTETEITDVILR